MVSFVRQIGSFFSLCLLACSLGCAHTTKEPRDSATKIDPWAEDGIQSVLWLQQSGEYEALCYQAFNLARLRLEQAGTNLPGQRLAVIVDIDETLVDNSSFRVRQIRNRESYSSKAWTNWVNEARARALPGAVDFLRFADRQGAQIFYVSNREEATGGEPTRQNLLTLGFPQLEADHFYLNTGSSSEKETRRRAIAELGQSNTNQFEVVLLLGDNLNDFNAVFEDSIGPIRTGHVADFQEEWGKRFIVLPNPTYGDWENGLYPRGALTEERAKTRRALMRD